MDRLPQRIADKIIPVTESGCWLWTASEERTGYGMVWWNGTRRMAHRVVWELLNGAIPVGLTLDHLCRVRQCVNPAHLESVDIRTNILRGTGLAAKNAVKTHCENGHEFTDKNTYRDMKGNRACRTCGRNHCNRWYARKRVLAL